MNHYEELGLTQSASVEEIRQAYKALVRLLHPDRQSEEQLRKVAELQMTRLNEILATLTDPLRREKYDASIRATVIEKAKPVWKRIHLARFRVSAGTIVWSASLVVAAIVFSFALLYFERGSAVPVSEGSSSQQTARPPVAMPVTTPVKEPVAALHASERRAKRVIKANEVDPPPATPEAPIPVEQAQDPPPNPTPAARPTSPRPDNSGATLVGTWLYSKSSMDAGTSGDLAYRPVYIEMVVKAGDSGKITGRYLGRFQVPDQALSSEVRFAFEGAVVEGTTVLPWRSSDGAEGQVRMKLVSDGAMEVAWYTTRFGTTPKLASGTAVLRRN